MKKFSVLITGQASLYVDIEAYNEDEAEEVAKEMFQAEVSKTKFKMRLENTEVYEG